MENSMETKYIVQGEDYVFYLIIYPTESPAQLQEVWAVTDEGFESTHITSAKYSTTLQLVFISDITSQMSTGQHYIRVFAKDSYGLKYSVFEMGVIVNPKFPIETREDFLNYKLPPNPIKTAVSKVTADNYKVYPLYRAQISSAFNLAALTKLYIVANENDKPLRADYGDLCLVSPDGEPHDNDDYLYICTQESPAIWRRITSKIFVGGEEGLVPPSYVENQVLNSDGVWRKVNMESVEQEDFIMSFDNLILEGSLIGQD